MWPNPQETLILKFLMENFIFCAKAISNGLPVSSVNGMIISSNYVS